MLAFLLASVAGCGLLPSGPEAPPGCAFPPETDLAFAGLTSAEELGLGSAGWEGRTGIDPDAQSRIYVSAEPIERLGKGDLAERRVCLISEGSLHWTTVPADWMPPAPP